MFSPTIISFYLKLNLLLIEQAFNLYRDKDSKMRKLQGSMWHNNHKYSLKTLLTKIPENNWHWYIYEFCGVGIAPDNLNMLEFEENVSALDKGYLISWKDLQKLANSLDDIDSFFAAASLEGNAYETIISDGFTDFFCKLEVLDSTSWKIIINSE